MSIHERLPKGWVATTLKDILPIQYGKGLTETIRNHQGTIPVYGSSGLVGYHDQALTLDETLIVGRKGSVGSVHYSSVPCWPIDTTYFVEKTTSINLIFFLHLLSSLQLIRLDKSTAIPGLSRGDYNEIIIKIPPLPEQTRIVAAIEQQFTRLDSAVASLKTAQEKAKQYRASLLKSAVEGELTRAWRAEHPASETGAQLLARILAERLEKMSVKPQGPDVANLSGLPEGWCWATVEQVGKVQLGRQRAPQHHKGPYMRPYLRVANVFEDHIDTSDILSMNFTPEEFETYSLKYGDILLNEGQSLELLGRPAMYRDEVPGACFQNTLIRFQAYTGLLAKYALIVFRAYMHAQKFQRIGKHTTNIAHLGAGRFAVLEFPLPPLAEQAQIVAEVEAHLLEIAKAEETIEHSLRRAEQERQSILREAFAGRLVEQDPKDEPASVLLERIREERRQRAEIKPLRKKGERKMDSSKKHTVYKAGGAYVYRTLLEAESALEPHELFKQAGLQAEDQSEAVATFYKDLVTLASPPLTAIEVERPDEQKVLLKVRELPPDVKAALLREADAEEEEQTVSNPTLWDQQEK